MFKYVVSSALVPSKSRLTEAGEKAQYWERLLDLWGVRARRGGTFDFPGSNPQSVSRASLARLRGGRVHVSLKSDGVRYVLLLTTRPSGESAVALMIDRAGNMFEVEVVAPEAYFLHGTVLEGELVSHQPSDGTTLFLVFDCVVSKGRRMTELPFEERLAEATRCTCHSAELAEVFSSDELEAKASDADAVVLVHYSPRLVMQPKHFVSLEHASKLWADRNEANHRVDGLVLQDVDAPYVVGSCDRCLKWKEVITVDLRGTAEALHCAQGPVAREVSTWHPPRVDPCSRIAATSAEDVLEYAVTSVDAQARTYTLFALRSRPDKLNPNSAHVLRSSLEECLDRIPLEDLCA